MREWKTATTRPKSATAYWLKKLGAEPVDFSPPRSGGTDGVEVVARVQKDNFEKVLRGKRGVRSLLSSLLCQRRRPRVQGCPTPSRIRPPGGCEEGEVGRSFHPRGCLAGERVSDCARRSATSIASLARSTRRRNPRGLSEKDGRPQIYLCRGAKLRSRHFGQAGLAQSKHPSEQGRPGVPSSGHRCRLPTEGLRRDFGCSLVRPAEPRKRQNAQVLVRSDKTTTRVPRRSRSRQGRNGWTPCNLRNLQCWQTSSRSYRYSWRRCSRLR